MTTHDWTDRPGDLPRLPLERPPREALRVYTVRFVVILLTQALIVAVMLVLFALVTWARHADMADFASVLVGGFLGFILAKRRAVAAGLRSLRGRLAHATGAFNMADRRPRQRRAG